MSTESSLGSLFRSVRVSKGMTLNETAVDCCIGFLSKFERNQVDNPNQEIIRKLCEKLDLDYDKVTKATNGSILNYCIQAIMYNDVQKLRNLYENLDENIPFSITLLIKGAYFYGIKQYNKFIAMMEQIDPIKHTIAKIEFAFYLILIIKYYVDTEQLNMAHRYVSYVISLEVEDKMIIIMSQELKFVINCRLRTNDVNFEYDKLKKYYDDNYPFRKQIMMKLEYLKAKENERAINALEYVYEDIRESGLLEYSDYRYALAYLYVQNEMYEKALEVYNYYGGFKITELNFRDLCLFGISIVQMYKLGKIDKDVKNKVLTKIKIANEQTKYDDKDIVHMRFLNYIIYQLEEAQQSFMLSYIRDDLLKNTFNLYRYSMYENYCINDYIKMIGSSSKYKEAFLLLGNIINGKYSIKYGVGKLK